VVRWVLVAGVVVVASCGAQPEHTASSLNEPAATSSVAPTSPITTGEVTTTTVSVTTSIAGHTSLPAVEGPMFETVTTVLESADHGPELCLGGVLDSLPPQCGDVPITNWDWDAIRGEDSANGTTWVDSAYVTGRFDGSRFTVVSARVATADDVARFRSEWPDFHAPCPEPADGWLAAAAGADPNAQLSEDNPVGQYVQSQPDGAGWWVDGSIDPNWPNGYSDPRKTIVVASFTGDLSRHEADLRELWSGALCVTLAKYSAQQLHDLALEVNALMEPDGTMPLSNGTVLRVLSFSDSGNFLTGTVDLDVMAAYPEAQQWFDQSYGPGRVVLKGVLRPLG
jgi:hypothetical protein